MLHDTRWDDLDSKLDVVGRALLAAEDYMRDHGWCRYWVTDRDGRVCMVGALLMSGEAEGDVLGDAIDRINGVIFPMHVTHWNDRTCANKKEALATLRKAAFR